jgi:hypothetical protein
MNIWTSLLTSFYKYGNINEPNTFYVDLFGTDGANISGSGADPFRTIAYACSRVLLPGQKIHINAGTYNEGTNRMNLALGVSIEGEGENTIILTADVGVWGFAAIQLDSPVANPVNGNQSISFIRINGNNVARRAININFRNNVEIHHCTFENFLFNAVVFRGNDQAFPDPPTVNYSTGNSCHHCIINNCARYGVEGNNQIDIHGQNGFLIYNNVQNQTQLALGLNGKLFGGDWNRGWKLHHCDYTKLDYNNVQWNFFTEIWHCQGNCEIYNNTFHGASTIDVVDVTLDNGQYGLKIYNNEFLVAARLSQFVGGHDQIAINIEERGDIEHVHIFKNHFVNYPNGIWIYAMNVADIADCHVHNIYVSYNIFEGSGFTDFDYSYDFIINGENPTIFEVYWNEIYVINNVFNSGASIGADHNCIEGHMAGVARNIYLRNNIIQNYSGYPTYFIQNVAGETVDVMSVENNCYFNNGVNASFWGGTLTITNLTVLNNVIGNPLFVGAGSYRLAAGSPCINTGLTIFGMFSDFSNTLVEGLTEIGVYQY